jgi:REP element-mobilizing transposase RayT
MPDHLHVILIGESDSSNLTELMRAFKGATTVPARKVGISALWQKGFYDHILRSEKEMGEAAWYMFLNPVRTGLAKRAEDWPYSGSFLFEWKSLAVPAEPFCPPWKKEKAKGKVAT